MERWHLASVGLVATHPTSRQIVRMTMSNFEHTAVLVNEHSNIALGVRRLHAGCDEPRRRSQIGPVT